MNLNSNNPIEHKSYLVMRHLMYRILSEPAYAQKLDRYTENLFDGGEVFQHMYSIAKQEYRHRGYGHPIQREWLRMELAGKLDRLGASPEERGMFDYVLSDTYTVDNTLESGNALNRTVSDYIRKIRVTNAIKKVVAQELSDDAIASFITDVDKINHDTASRELPHAVNVMSKEYAHEIAESMKELLVARTPMALKSYNLATSGGLSKGEMGCIAGSSGTGKAEPHSTLLPTPSGIRRFGDLAVGDYVYNRFGNPVRIGAIYEQGEKQAYKVTTEDGRSSIFNNDHLFSYVGDKGTTDPGALETKSLQEMMDTGLKRADNSNRYHIPTSVALEFPEKDVALRPYTLGTTIGDNHDKRIPTDYLQGSINQRLDLVRGLFDTDGSVHICKSTGIPTVSYHTTNAQLASDVLDLVWSLGYKAQRKTQQGDYYAEYVINVDSSIDKLAELFSSPEKLGSFKGATDSTYNYDRVAIESIEDLGYATPMRCIYVEDEEHLYVTNNYIVTHNTMHLTSIASGYASQGQDVAYFALEELAPRMIHRFYKNVVSLYFQTAKDVVLDAEQRRNLATLRNSADVFENGSFYQILDNLRESGINFGNLYLIKYLPYEMGISELTQSLEDLTVAQGKNVDVVCIDYPDLMDYDRSAGESEAGGRLYASIRGVGQKYDVIMWVASQLNRTTYGADLKTEAHMEGSYRKQNALEFLGIINQYSEEYENGFTRIYVAKARNSTSAKGTEVQVSVDSPFGVLRDQTTFEANKHALIINSCRDGGGDSGSRATSTVKPKRNKDPEPTSSSMLDGFRSIVQTEINNALPKTPQ